MSPHRIQDHENILGQEDVFLIHKNDIIQDWPGGASKRNPFRPTNPINKLVKLELILEMSPDGSFRTGSFSSVKEDADGLPQSFLVRVSSARQGPSHEAQVQDWAKCLPAYGVPLDDTIAIEDDVSDVSEATTPDNNTLSRYASFLDAPPPRTPVNLQELPLEVLENVVDFLTTDLPPQDHGPRNTDLLSCLLASKPIHQATINVLYKSITIPHSYVFSKFLAHLKKFPDLGRLVRRLDLSHFTSIGLGRTIDMNKEIQNMTSKTLLECIELMPHLQELLLQEHLDHDIDEAVLFKIFTGLSKLRALDLCGAYANGFEKSFTAAMDRAMKQGTNFRINRLSLHECFTIKNADIRALISRLHKLEILDVYHTRITAATLESIPHTARLTHLNLGLCTNITGPEVVRFLKHHPAASELVYLNLSCDPARHRMLRSPDLDDLLPHLPTTLRSLNLGGAQIIPANHLQHLIRLSSHLEELGLAHAPLSMADLKSFFPPPPPSPTSSPLSLPADTPTPTPTPSLHYHDLTDIPSVSQSSLFHHRSSSRIDASHPAPIPHFLSSTTLPLSVLELNRRVISDLQRMKTSNSRFGWEPKELGRRSWYVRVQGSQERDPTGGRESGERWWKMGCRSWGMRKCPVVVAEVGGLYGFHMFKK